MQAAKVFLALPSRKVPGRTEPQRSTSASPRGTSVSLTASSPVEHAGVPGLGDQPADGREPDVNGRGGEIVHRAAPLIQQRAAQGPALGEGEDLVEGVPVGGLCGWSGPGINHHSAELALGGSQAGGLGRGRPEDAGASLPRYSGCPGIVDSVTARLYLRQSPL